ncbi:metal ABC transporter solute-binding protein, Zn/Mn family [Fundicoccus sp. Sow4_F4]|uniref:metal ABC transporter solute-binding protein, Zn/Mn family n=1 Tax=Fundicoccus sp. Sow4_F4 TaxID=3438783 RepID=UPI003F911A9D
MKTKTMQLTKRLLALLAVLCFGLGQLPTVVAQDKKEVMTTFYPVYYLAQRIGGDAVEVSMLLEGNQSAHDYEVSAKDAARTQAADLFIYQNDEMEYFVSSLLTLIDTQAVQVLESTASIDLLAGEHHEEEHHEDEHHEDDEDHHHHEDDHHGHSHEYDPHTWLDPMIYAKQADNVKNALIELDPANQTVFEKNAAQLIEELTQLNDEFKTQLSALENRRMVVQHAAFGYLAHAYDLQQVAIAGISTTQEPSARELATMQDFIAKEQVNVVFVEPSLDSAIAKAVTSDSEVELRPLRTLEFVSTDEEAQGVDYFSIMRDNLVELTR